MTDKEQSDMLKADMKFLEWLKKLSSIKIVQMDVSVFERHDVENMEGQTFESEQDFLDRWKEETHSHIHIFTLSSYMDELNDEIYPTKFWVTYILI